MFNNASTTVLLIGVSEYTEDTSIIPIPNVLANISNLKRCLVHSEIAGIPVENLTESSNETKSAILKKLNKACKTASKKTDTLLVYYSGHGFIGNRKYQLHLATPETNSDDLIDAIPIEEFKEHLRYCNAGRKILILDCCHSGGAIAGDRPLGDTFDSAIRNFEGAYVITSSSEDEISLFPADKPEEPTYFTGKLVELMENGLDSGVEFCSLREIYNHLEADFRLRNLPLPKQSVYHNADELYFFRNRKFVSKASDKIAWEKALKDNNIAGYIAFSRSYPDSEFSELASTKLSDLEDIRLWKQVSSLDAVHHYERYLRNFPKGRYAEKAQQKIDEILAAEKEEYESEEREVWAEVIKSEDEEKIKFYLRRYPKGLFKLEAELQLKEMQSLEDQHEMFWQSALAKNTIESFKEYLSHFPRGHFREAAQNEIKKIEQITLQQAKSDEELRVWLKAQKTGEKKEYENYLSLYPNGEFKSIACTFLDNLAKEEAKIIKGKIREHELWEKTKKSKDKSDYELYIKSFPHGKFLLAAKDWIHQFEKVEKIQEAAAAKEQKIWENALQFNLKTDYEYYLKIYLDGKFAPQARERIASFDKNVTNESAAKEQEPLEKTNDSLYQTYKTRPQQVAVKKPTFSTVKLILPIMIIVALAAIGYFSSQRDPVTKPENIVRDSLSQDTVPSSDKTYNSSTSSAQNSDTVRPVRSPREENSFSKKKMNAPRDEDFPDFEKAKATASDQENADLLLKQGIWAFENRYYEQCIALLNQSLLYGKGNFRLYSYLGQSLFRNGHQKEAIENMLKSRQVNPYINKNVENALGRMYFDTREYEKSLECFSLAIRADTSSATNYYNTGLVYYEGLNNYPRAISNLKLSLKKGLHEKLVSDAYTLLGLCYYRQADYNNAITNLSKAEELRYYPSEELYLYLGLSFRNIGNRSVARSMLEKAIALNSANSQATAALSQLPN